MVRCLGLKAVKGGAHEVQGSAITSITVMSGGFGAGSLTHRVADVLHRARHHWEGEHDVEG